MTVIHYIHRRGFLIAGMLLGGILFVVLFMREQKTRETITQVQHDVKVIRETSPCTGLTTAECAYKLLRALPEDQLQRIRVNERTLERLAERARRERRALERGNVIRGADGKQIRLPGDNDKPRRPAPESPPPRPSSPQVETPTPSAPTPTAPSAPTPPSVPTPTTPTTPVTVPSVSTPEIKTPEVGPVPSVTVPSITVPCIAVDKLISCEGR